MKIRDIVKSMANTGITIFLTTQYLDEAEYLADRIAILHKGVIIANGTAIELKEKLPQGIIKLQFKNSFELKRAIDLLNDYLIHNGKEKYEVYIQTDGTAIQFADVLSRINHENIEIFKFAPKQPTLEDAFLTLIGDKKEEANHEG